MLRFENFIAQFIFIIAIAILAILMFIYELFTKNKDNELRRYFSKLNKRVNKCFEIAEELANTVTGNIEPYTEEDENPNTFFERETDVSLAVRKKEYLSGPIWYHKKQLIHIREENTCQMCGSKKSEDVMLFVHHTTYEHLFNEPLEDLVLVCKECHTLIHRYYGTYNPQDKYPMLTKKQQEELKCQK